MSEAYFSQLEMMSRRSLRMYDLTGRERRISDVIIDYSFARGRESALIPELQAFVDLTGLDKGDVSRTLQRLTDKGIVQESGPVGAKVYSFIPSAAFWTERKPQFDVERAIARSHQLEELNKHAAGYEPTGQGKLPLPADAPGLEEGMAMAAREAASEPDWRIGESPIGKTPTMGGVGDSPICENPSRDRERAYAPAGDVLQNVSTQYVSQYVTDVGESPTTAAGAAKRRSFADPKKDYAFELVEKLSSVSPKDWLRNRWNWLKRVRDNDEGIVIEAVGNVRGIEENRKHKRTQPIGAVLFRECQKVAVRRGKSFHLW